MTNYNGKEVLNGLLFIKSMMSVENVERQAIALRKLATHSYSIDRSVIHRSFLIILMILYIFTGLHKMLLCCMQNLLSKQMAYRDMLIL